MAPSQPGRKLFILDARNGVERRHLLAWLRSTQNTESPFDWLSLPISQEGRIRLNTLAAKLKQPDDVLVVPVRIAWQIPERLHGKALGLRHLVFGDPRSPGRLWALAILLRNRSRAHCLSGSPATIGELRARFQQRHEPGDEEHADDFAGFVLRQAGLVLDIAERGLRGSRYKSPGYVAEGVRTSPRFRRAMRDLAQETGQALNGLNEEASGYLREVVARPSPLFIDLKARFDRFLLSQGYEEEVVFDQNELPRLRQTMRDYPTLILFTHKTYVDGVTPTDICYRNDLPMLHVFGGINMDLFGFGYILRRAGTIFIRRGIEDNRVYKLVLRHYVGYLLEKRFPMTWAFEGTRSRLGKLMPPRYGLLKYVMDSAHANDVRNVHIIPVSTSFDLIRDVEEYATEQTGRVKKPETFKWFIGYLRSLREPMGRVYVDFGKPVVIPQAPDPEDRLALSKIAFEVAVEANNVTPLTLTSMMCFCLLGTAPRAATAEELSAALHYLTDWARQRGIRMSDDLAPENLTGSQKVVKTLLESRLFIRYDQGSSRVYTIEPNQHPIASYYRNSIIHHFLNKAIIELALFKARESRHLPAAPIFWEETERLRDWFKFEFFYPGKDEFRRKIEEELDRVDPEWRRKLETGGTLLKSLSNRMQPLVSHAVFLPFVESYTVVLDLLARLKPGESITQQRCVEQAIKEGRQAYLLRRITSEASIGKILFENGFKLAANRQLVGESTEESIRKRQELLREFRGLSLRMEKSRLEVLAFAEKYLLRRI